MYEIWYVKFKDRSVLYCDSLAEALGHVRRLARAGCLVRLWSAGGRRSYLFGPSPRFCGSRVQGVSRA